MKPTREEARTMVNEARKLHRRAELQVALARLPLTRQGVPDLDQLGRPPRTDRRDRPQLEPTGCPRCGSPFAHGCPCEDQDRAPGRQPR